MGRLRISARMRMPTLMIGASLLLSIAALSLLSPSPATSKGEVAQAEDAPAEAGGEPQKPKKVRPPEPKPKPKPAAATPDKAKPDAAKAAAPTESGGLAGAAAAGANTAALNIAAKLAQNGVGACSSTIDAAAAPSMVGVTESNTVSLWSNVEPRDKHSTSVFVGQRYGASPAVPFGVTGLISSQTPSGSCDVTVVQVVSSPLPCGKVRETLARGGKVLGDIVGMPLIQSGENQTLLMPTATNTCVLVGFQSKFGN